MKKLRLLWHLYPAFLVITLVAILAVTWYVSSALRQFHIVQTEKNLTARANLIIDQVQDDLTRGNAFNLDELSKRLGKKTETRITIILNDGKVLADSRENPQRMDNHARRPEVAAALSGSKGVSTRFSRTLQQNQMYVALPVSADGTIIGCVRTSIPVTAIGETLEALYQRIAGAGFLIAVVLAVLSLWLARRISQPLERMRRGAERFALGELDRRLPISGAEELADLAGSLNDMAAQLDERFQTVIRQRNELEAVLSSMVEGVLAVDNNETIIRINRAAANLFAVEPETIIARPVQEVLRKAELQQFIHDAISAKEPIERNLTIFRGNQEVLLQAHGSPLRNAQEKKIGALIVFNDITRLRRLENLRRDFVANVSHELKTPITAIKGWAETLRESKKDAPDEETRPIEVIVRQSDRLNAIVNDLLDLSRIEQEQEGAKIELQQAPIRPVIDATAQACSVDLEKKRIALTIVCTDSLKAPINPPLLEQALINLLNNAIKYSPEQSRVIIETAENGPDLMIKVTDFGCGIPTNHLPRLFERFYRVDVARSREMGGTGLGLAIVKHIAQAHHGSIEVESSPGKGSCFTLTLPLR